MLVVNVATSGVVRLLTCVLSLAPAAAVAGARERGQERNQRESNAWPDTNITTQFCRIILGSPEIWGFCYYLVWPTA